jgi:putative NIF3 family GTP cyclohydrolase 1 type 2
MDLSFMTAWFDDLLDPKSFNDYCVNGLCVEAKDKVTKIVTGVSLRDQLIDAAIAEHADCIIVHHPNGFWKGESQLPVGKFAERLRKLMNNGISVFGFHLPLDAHREIGNNAVIAKLLGLNPVHEFVHVGMRAIGVIAEWNTPATREELIDGLSGAFVHGVQNQFFYGPEEIKRVAICSGSCSVSDIR